MLSRAHEPLSSSSGLDKLRLVINGKFLQPSTNRSGVYRVAREMLYAIDKLLTENPE